MSRCCLSLLILAAALVNSVGAQESRRDESRGRSRGGFRLPEQGAQLPDLAALDERGRKFSLRENLGEKYTVLVFGCLT